MKGDNMGKKVRILSLDINNIRMEEIINQLSEVLSDNKKKKLIYTPNSEIVVKAFDSPKFDKILKKADYLVPDGAGLLLASKILKVPFKERVAGYDLMMNLLEYISDKRFSVYLLGGKSEVIEQAVGKIKSKYFKINISGYHHGYIDQKKEREIINEINKKCPDILMVGMGAPLQESFFNRYFDTLNIKIGLAVGGSFDVISGQVKRAPIWIQKIYLEWLYRLFQEPHRIKRMVALPRFVYLVLKEKINSIN